MTAFTNKAISASAGTGKTFRLAHRYLALMDAGVSADRICALTFSRKAAGEIFDKIVEILCDAATDKEKAAQSTAMIKAEGLRASSQGDPDYPALLKNLLESIHRLRVGTLDSFIFGVVRSFPLELGVPPNVVPIDENGGEAREVRSLVMRHLFSPANRDVDALSFLEAFQTAQYGISSKTIEKPFGKFIEDYMGFYQHHKGEKWGWGDIDSVWPTAQQWWKQQGAALEAPDYDEIYISLTSAFGSGTRQQQLRDGIINIIKTGFQHTIDSRTPDNLGSYFPQIVESAASSDPSLQVSYYGKPYDIPDSLWPLLRWATCNMVGVEVLKAGNRSKGIRDILERYSAIYNDIAFSQAKVTFSDLSMLLGGEITPSRAHSDDGSNRLYIDYRLDSQLDHWLLDEFQDTSDSQWQTLANLVDETIQNPERSFFYVGDIKQSIYGWRGGNYRLFGEILDRFNQADYKARYVQREVLDTCYRSLPNVLKAVNTVFQNLPSWVPKNNRGEPSPPDNWLRKPAIDAFVGDGWPEHISGVHPEKGRGYAALIEYGKSETVEPKQPDDDDSDTKIENKALEAVAEIIREVQPHTRNLECAVLVRNNVQGKQCVDYLRGALRDALSDINIVHEGTGGIMDHPVVTLFLSLLRYAAHPADTIALRHLQMSNLWRHLLASTHTSGETRSTASADTQLSLPTYILTQLHRQGFAATIRHHAQSLGELDDFARQRLDLLLSAAEEFDKRNEIDIDAFHQLVENYATKSTDSSGQVRVMTIHQSKGLGFDIVIVPFDPKAKSFGSPGDTEILAGTGIDTDNWVLKPPASIFTKAAGGKLVESRERNLADANFAQLCVLYVAMTRAAKALYLLVPPQPKSKSDTLREANLLRDTLISEPKPADCESADILTTLAEFGEKKWYRDYSEKDAVGETKLIAAAKLPDHLEPTFTTEIMRDEPSKEQGPDIIRSADWLFSAEAGDVPAFGLEMHRLFEHIEWIDDADPDTILADWRRSSQQTERILRDVEKQFRSSLESPEIRRCLSRNSYGERAEIWREAPFNLILDVNGRSQLVSGRFDRVVVERDSSGRPVSAHIIDYKSSMINSRGEMAEKSAEYSRQILRYRQAAAVLLGLPLDSIRTSIIFTRVGWIANPDA